VGDVVETGPRLADRLARALAPVAHRLLTPALVVDLDAAAHNARAVQDMAGPGTWRPHVKTIKQRVLVAVLLDAGVRHFKCATPSELHLVLDTARTGGHPGVDVLVAYPVTPPFLDAVLHLAAAFPDATVHLVADAPAHLQDLGRWLGERGTRAPVLLDVDTGMGRTGRPAGDWARAAAHGGLATPHAHVAGLHAYEGHLGFDDREAAWRGYDELCGLARALPEPPGLVVTSGSHSFHHALAHPGLGHGPWRAQVSPGTVVLSDRRTGGAAARLGLRQAALVATRVVSTPGDDRVTLDAGSKAVSPDRPAPACAVLGRDDLEPLAASEEHLPVRCRGARPARGDLLFLVPDHVCTTVNLYQQALWVRGDAVVGHGPVEAAGHRLWASPETTACPAPGVREQ
jgi:D-serine deaminase-like pyridoxal phosphate-dependent protein